MYLSASVAHLLCVEKSFLAQHTFSWVLYFFVHTPLSKHLCIRKIATVKKKTLDRENLISRRVLTYAEWERNVPYTARCSVYISPFWFFHAKIPYRENFLVRCAAKTRCAIWRKTCDAIERERDRWCDGAMVQGIGHDTERDIYVRTGHDFHWNFDLAFSYFIRLPVCMGPAHGNVFHKWLQTFHVRSGHEWSQWPPGRVLSSA